MVSLVRRGEFDRDRVNATLCHLLISTIRWSPDKEDDWCRLEDDWCRFVFPWMHRAPFTKDTAGISSHREKEHGAGLSAIRLKPH